MNKPLISIIIPVYNDEPYIAETLESCVKQTFDNIEIIVVDDASTDKTPDVIAKYSKSDTRIQTIRHTRNEKTFTSIRDGVMLASGEYTVIISGDDTFDLNAMEVIAGVIKDNPGVDIVHFGRRVISENGNELRSLVPDNASLKGGEILKSLFTPLGESKVNHHVRRRSISVDIYNEFFKRKKKFVLGEDQIMAFLYLLRAKSYVGIKNKLYNYYFYRGNDGSKKVTLDHFIDYRMNIIDSMDELQRCIATVGVDGWVWERFFALRRHHYAWAVFATENLDKKEADIALGKWVERADAAETLIGIMLATPSILNRYVNFVIGYNKSNQGIDVSRRIIRAFQDDNRDTLVKQVADLKDENNHLSVELKSFLSIKRSLKLTIGNVKRRILHGKNR